MDNDDINIILIKEEVSTEKQKIILNKAIIHNSKSIFFDNDDINKRIQVASQKKDFNPSNCAIYIIQDKRNRQIIYVGSSTDINPRINKHKSNWNKKDTSVSGMYLIPFEYIKILIIEKCDYVKDKFELKEVENRYIDIYNPKFNKRKAISKNNKKDTTQYICECGANLSNQKHNIIKHLNSHHHHRCMFIKQLTSNLNLFQTEILNELKEKSIKIIESI